MQYLNTLYKSNFFSLPVEEKKKIYIFSCFVFVFSFLTFGDQAFNTFVKHDDWKFIDGTYGTLLPLEGRFICYAWSLLAPYFPSLFTIITAGLILWSFSVALFCHYLLKPFNSSSSLLVLAALLACSPPFRDALEWPYGSFILIVAFCINTICSTFLYSRYKWIAFPIAALFSLLVTQPLWFVFSLQVISYILFDFVFSEEKKGAGYGALFKTLLSTLAVLVFSLAIAILTQKLLLYIAFHTTSLQLQAWRNPNPISSFQDILINLNRASAASIQLLQDVVGRIGINLPIFSVTLGVLFLANIFFGQQGHFSKRAANATLLFITCTLFFFSLSLVTILTGIDLPFRSQPATWISFCIFAVFLTINLTKPVGNILLSVLFILALMTASQNSKLLQKRGRQVDMDISIIRHVEQDLFAIDAYEKNKKIVFWGTMSYWKSQTQWFYKYRSYRHLITDYTLLKDVTVCVARHCDGAPIPQQYKNAAARVSVIFPARGYISEEGDFIFVKMGNRMD